MNIKVEIKITIDMCLDGYLVVVYKLPDGRQSQLGLWCTPNLDKRDGNDWSKYWPDNTKTDLVFNFKGPLGTVIDTEKSCLQLGYTGNRDIWVGPGQLFAYSLSRYIPENIVLQPKE